MRKILLIRRVVGWEIDGSNRGPFADPRYLPVAEADCTIENARF
ncbi:hypothetical protein [Streptomyces sp. NPDC058572]